MRVLVAVDDSEHSLQTLKTVGSTAWPSGTAILIVSAVKYGLPPPPAPAWTGVSIGFKDYGEILKTEAEALVVRAAETIRREDVSVETVVRAGNPRSVILKEAERWSADLIVMGSGDATGLRRWLGNNVIKYVVAHAPCSVEVIRTKPNTHVEQVAA